MWAPSASAAPSDDIHAQWEVGFRNWDRPEASKDSLHISEGWLNKLAEVMIADKSRETLALLATDRNDPNAVSDTVVEPEQNPSAWEVSTNLYSQKNIQQRKLLDAEWKVAEVMVHDHFTGMAFSLSDQDKETYVAMWSLIGRQILTFRDVKNNRTYFRAYDINAEKWSISPIDISVWSMKGEIIMKDEFWELHTYSWPDAKTAIYAAENGITFEKAKIYMWPDDTVDNGPDGDRTETKIVKMYPQPQYAQAA
jgi:hypothetical protein